ncbi:MAG: hypothetical protein ACXU8U_05360 [Asticcacaulis sp.]
MKFLAATYAAEGLNSYARVRRVRPMMTALNILEGLFGMIGVAAIILLIRFGSFEKAGAAVDAVIHSAVASVVGAHT